MLKATFKLIKFIITFTIWTFLYVQISGSAIYHFWSFNFLSPEDWQRLKGLWDKGATIQTFEDYIFIFCLIILLPLWLWGIRFFYKLNYLGFLLSPFSFYSKKRYGSNGRNITLKNMGLSQKMTMDDMINQRMQKTGETKKEESVSIRKIIQNKINSAKN